MIPYGPTEVVQHGYDQLSHRYRGDDDTPAEYEPWLDRLRQQLPAGARVLDLGCGCGIPVAKTLADAGHQVTGVDLSEVQIGRARRLVPQATFLQADATQVTFPEGSFDAVVCLYALIHMPLDTQPRLLRRIAGWLRPGGLLLATTGSGAWTGTDENWLGGDTPMWWSHADAAAYREWITQAGLHVDSEDFVPEAGNGHQLFWAHRPEAAVISTDRLDLRLLDAAALQAIADGDRDGQRWAEGFPREDDQDAARMTLRHVDPVFGCFAIVERSTGLTVGTIGFFGAPDAAGATMIGYGLAPSARGAGYATEALRALAAFAFARDDVLRLEADPEPGNVASHRVLEKAGFVRTRETADAYWYTAERLAPSGYRAPDGEQTE